MIQQNKSNNQKTTETFTSIQSHFKEENKKNKKKINKEMKIK